MSENQSISRRTRKRLATRDMISDAATRLFIERGFDHVTIDEIAEAADVGRQTVFNHFPRKEDMFFDLYPMGHEDLVNAMRQPSVDISPIEKLRIFGHQIVTEQRPYIRFYAESQQFIEAIAASESLKARARAIRDELAITIQAELTSASDRSQNDPDASLAANLLVSAWGVAFIQAHRTFHRTSNQLEAQQMFLSIIDRGIQAVKAAIIGSPYV